MVAVALVALARGERGGGGGAGNGGGGGVFGGGGGVGAIRVTGGELIASAEVGEAARPPKGVDVT
jgi:hypothetical protein